MRILERRRTEAKPPIPLPNKAETIELNLELLTITDAPPFGAIKIEAPRVETAEPAESNPAQAPRQPRLVSLDAFRGLTVLLMLIVNNIALDKLTPDSLMHGAWNQGLSLADYVFPWFLLCVGLSIPFSFASFAKLGLPSWRHDIRIWTRFGLLMVLGCLVNCAYEKRLFFSLGVLQLIAMAYLVGAYAYELPKVRKAIVAILMLVGYGLAIKFLPVPGSPLGTFTEDTNFITHINRTYLLMYNLDGLFSTIPTAALVILGSLVGDALMSRKLTHAGKVGVMVLVGTVMALCGAFYNLWIPYNKPVWTPSYILITGGIGVLVVAVLYLLTDAVNSNKWSFPLRVFGSNALLAYTIPVFLKLTILSVWTVQTPQGNMPLLQAMVLWFVDHMGRVAGGWTYTCLYIVCWWSVLLFLYRRRTYLRA